MSNTEAAIWRALGHPLRRRVLDLLRDGPRTTGELAERFSKLSRFAVMQHLGVLEKSGLVLARRDGRLRFNHLNPAPIQRIYERWMSRYAQRLAAPASALKSFIENADRESAEIVGGDMASKKKHEFRVANVEVEISFDAPRTKVWKALTQQSVQWWPKDFCMKPDRVKAFRVEFKSGGKMYEDWGRGDGLVWWTISRIDSETFSFECHGPLTEPAWDHVTFTLEERGKKTLLRISDRIWGSFAKGYEDKHDGGWKYLFNGAFKKFVEK